MDLNKDNLDCIYNLRLQGYSWSYIEDLFDKSARSIRTALVRNKYNLDIMPSVNNKVDSLTEDQVIKAKQLKLEGKSIKEISKIIGCYTSQLKRKGILYINSSKDDYIRYKININYFDYITSDKQAYFF